MPISTYTKLVQERLKPMVTAIYNLNFKNRTNHPDFKKYESDGVEITIYPHAIDYTRDGKTLAMIWEVIDGKPCNVTFPHENHLDEVTAFLKQYVWGTE